MIGTVVKKVKKKNGVSILNTDERISITMTRDRFKCVVVGDDGIVCRCMDIVCVNNVWMMMTLRRNAAETLKNVKMP